MAKKSKAIVAEMPCLLDQGGVFARDLITP